MLSRSIYSVLSIASRRSGCKGFERVILKIFVASQGLITNCAKKASGARSIIHPHRQGNRQLGFGLRSGMPTCAYPPNGHWHSAVFGHNKK